MNQVTSFKNRVARWCLSNEYLMIFWVGSRTSSFECFPPLTEQPLLQNGRNDKMLVWDLTKSFSGSSHLTLYKEQGTCVVSRISLSLISERIMISQASLVFRMVKDSFFSNISPFPEILHLIKRFDLGNSLASLITDVVRHVSSF